MHQPRVPLDETLGIYERCVRPMQERFIRPSSRKATFLWRQLEDRGFPQRLLKTLHRRARPNGRA